MLRYWWFNGSLWASEWMPYAHLCIIDVRRWLDWIEGTYVWDSKAVRR